MIRGSFIVCVITALAAWGCASQNTQTPETTPDTAPAEQAEATEGEEVDFEQYPDNDGTETLASTRESNQVWTAIRSYLAENQDLANTFDIPGDEYGPASLDTFHAVHRNDGSFSTCVDFRDGSHQFDVDFVVSSGPEFTVQEATLHRVDGAEITATVASN